MFVCLFKIGSSVAQAGLEPALCKDHLKFPILLSPPEFWLHAPWLLTDICMEVLRYSGRKFPLVCLLLTVTGLAHLLMVPQKWHLRVHGGQSIAQWHQWGQQFHQPHFPFSMFLSTDGTILNTGCPRLPCSRILLRVTHGHISLQGSSCGQPGYGEGAAGGNMRKWGPAGLQSFSAAPACSLHNALLLLEAALACHLTMRACMRACAYAGDRVSQCSPGSIFWPLYLHSDLSTVQCVSPHKDLVEHFLLPKP